MAPSSPPPPPPPLPPPLFRLLLLLLSSSLLISSFASGEEDLPCVPRDFGHSSFVCVCNASYCDTLSRPTLPPEDQYLVYSSAKDGGRFYRTQGYFAGRQEEGSEDARGVEFVLDTATTYQTVMGWGGAITDAAALNVLSLSVDAQDLLLRSYFSASGLEYNLVRINMGGCDFSWRTYTHADTEGDAALQTFELQPEDLEYKIPVIKRVQAMSQRPIKLLASPWTAPPWMKTNNDYIGFGQLRKDMYQPWANYYVRFLEEYGAQNITFWGLTAQNEPIDGYVPGFFFNCMGWTPQEQRDWIGANLGPTLRDAGYGDLLLMFLDDQRFNLPWWAEVILNTTYPAAQFVDGIAVHWYGDLYTPVHFLDDTHYLFPEYFLLGTEACDGEGPLKDPVVLGSWERLERYAHDIIVDVNHWLTGWVDWNIALDMEGGPNWAENFVDSPIIVNKEQDEFYKNPMFYAMGHFAKFVVEGAIRVDLTSPDQGKLDSTAFLNPDGSKVIILLNRSSSEQLITVRIKERGTIALSLNPRSLHTVIFK